MAVIGSPGQWRMYLDDPTLVKPNCEPQIDETARVGAFTIVDAGCIRPTIIGPGTFVQHQVHVGHGVQIGADCEIASGTVIAGEVTIGNRVRIGVGALLKPFITIGDDVRIGMGAVVTQKTIASHECWAGNPARWLYSYCHECLTKIDHHLGYCDECVLKMAYR